ncbi:MAG: hypothetical protein ACRCUY_05165 [Thermoguttaceae bacterium]
MTMKDCGCHSTSSKEKETSTDKKDHKSDQKSTHHSSEPCQKSAGESTKSTCQ